MAVRAPEGRPDGRTVGNDHVPLPSQERGIRRRSMHAYPGFDRRMMRALLWLSVLATLAAFGAARALAESAPPASAPANGTTAPSTVAKSSTPVVTPASSVTTQSASAPAASAKPATV